MAQVADAEVRLFHLYVHEPLMRSGASGIETAEEMLALSRELLPLASPVMDQIHQRYLQHFVEQDVIGHMESDLDGERLDLGRLRVAIAFADLAGYTRLTEEEGELEAVDAVERFVEAVEVTLPDDARVIKTIGDEVMIVGSDPAGADRLGRRVPAPAARTARARGSASTTASPCTGTATTTAGTSTSRRGSPRAPPAARCWSRARSSRRRRRRTSSSSGSARSG